MMTTKLASALACGVCLVAIATPASAQTRTYSIPAGSLKSALDSYSRQSGRPIIYKADQVRGVHSAGAGGHMSAEAALQALLAGTPFRAQQDSSGAIAIVKVGNVPATAETAQSSGQDGDQQIVVTGSRIRGASSTSAVIEVTDRDISASGKSNLPDLIRTIPQNFTGGQNPGVLGGGALANGDYGGGASLNLRGLGPDATLTLLNGRRLPYDSFQQATDISSIPLAALDRIEIVADGASAIYGSDAVGGVANIILKRNFRGLTASASYETTTKEGLARQVYSVVGGTTWQSGGVLAAYSFDRNDALLGVERPDLQTNPTDATLFPALKRQAAVLSFHQSIASDAELGMDATFGRRVSRDANVLPFSNSENIWKTTSFAMFPYLKVGLGEWNLSASGTYGKSHLHYDNAANLPDGTLLYRSTGCYCNLVASAEVSAEGPVAEIGSIVPRLAIGGGYRRNEFHQIDDSGFRLDGTRQSKYVFGELFIPFIRPASGLAWANELSVTAAVRYEDYRDLGRVATPKVGFSYSPLAGLRLRGSWGQSYKAPTLVQQFQAPELFLYPSDQLGGSDAPPGSTAFLAYGGNRSLKPERADTWSITATLGPEIISGFRADISYFKVNFRDRVAQPFPDLAVTLSSPEAGSFVLRNPSQGDISAFLAQSPGGFANFTPDGNYDPTSVIAIASDYYVNVAKQEIDGVDLSLSYRLNLGQDRNLTATSNVTYLESSQRLTPTSPVTTLAGTIYNPPHWRGRTGLTYESGGLLASAFYNYIGGVLDDRTSPAVHVKSMSTVDVSLRYQFGKRGGALNEVEIFASVQNLTDAAPPYARAIPDYSPLYDSTNYSPLGRSFNLGISKHF